jgi:cytochrome c oxidase subunit I
LEWTTSSPPAIENWEVLPVLTHGPYEYGTKKSLAIRERLGMAAQAAIKTGVPVSDATSSTFFSSSTSASQTDVTGPTENQEGSGNNGN